ncbi:MAG: hydroxymethylglutaryl-CoA lyase [Planctomycetota bacterium]|jgi:hydroxymethylglutaryl-CoA lyase
MSAHVTISDVAPRDGLQNEDARVPTEDKAALIRALSETGVDAIEYTSFVSPKWIPQLGDAQELLASLADLRSQPNSAGCIALVPNARGYERAIEHHSEETPLTIAVFTAASESFNRNNTNASIDESIARFAEFLPDALERGMQVRLYISTVIACPFEGIIQPAQVRRVADQLNKLLPPDAIEAGRAELDLGDTIGHATPASTESLLEAFGEDERARLVMHFHDTYDHAAVCVRTSLDMGVRSFDSSTAGLGGCPYASRPGNPAPGNISTRTLVETIEDAGFRTSVDKGALARAEGLASDILSRAREAQRP